tara:strand:+ start:140 stop:685 length:546 start_codon:yes stop_codon:yes gene_type:complete
MNLVNKFLDEVLIFNLKKYEDNRGFFLEKYHQHRYSTYGINMEFVQDSQSRSLKNVLRGLHLTINKPQSQLMTVVRGKVFDVVVDIRKNSKTFGKYKGFILSDEGPQQILIPHGFAHGFCVLSEYADLVYKTTKLYDSDDEYGIVWNDSDIGIDWPIDNPIISNRDLNHGSLNDYLNLINE